MEDFLDNNGGTTTDPTQTEEGSTTEPNQSTQTQENDDYSFERWQKEKGYKDANDLGKAYGNANKQLNTVQTENKKFREYIQQSIPWIQYAEQKYKEEQGKSMNGDKNKTVPKDPTNTTANTNAETNAKVDTNNPDVMRNMIKEVAQEILGPQINKLQSDVTKGNVGTILKEMRADKRSFPYMNPELEEEMNNVLKLTNKSFPVNEGGIKELYNAAVGRRLPKILNEFKTKVTDDLSVTEGDLRESFIESDRIGEAGNVKDLHKNIADSIVNAPYGKSQI